MYVCSFNWVSRKIALITVFVNVWNGETVEWTEYSRLEGVVGKEEQHEVNARISWMTKMSLRLLKFSCLLYFHCKLRKLDQTRFLTLPCWHTAESNQWLTICYINSLITLCYPPIWKRTLISCHSTIQCCQLTPFTVSILLVHTSLISPTSAAKPLERNLVMKTYRALQISSALTGYGESWTPDAKKPGNPYKYRKRLVNKHLQNSPFRGLLIISRNLALATPIFKIASDLRT